MAAPTESHAAAAVAWRLLLWSAGRRLLLGEDADSIPTGDPAEFQELFPSAADVRRRFTAGRGPRLPLPPPLAIIPPAAALEDDVAHEDGVVAEEAPAGGGTSSVAMVSHEPLPTSEDGGVSPGEECSCGGGDRCSCGGLPALMTISNQSDSDDESEDGEEQEDDDRAPPPAAKRCRTSPPPLGLPPESGEVLAVGAARPRSRSPPPTVSKRSCLPVPGEEGRPPPVEDAMALVVTEARPRSPSPPPAASKRSRRGDLPEVPVPPWRMRPCSWSRS